VEESGIFSSQGKSAEGGRGFEEETSENKLTIKGIWRDDVRPIKRQHTRKCGEQSDLKGKERKLSCRSDRVLLPSAMLRERREFADSGVKIGMG